MSTEEHIPTADVSQRVTDAIVSATEGATGDGSTLIPVRERGAVAPLSQLEQVRAYVRASKAESTLRGYQSDWRDFCGWAEAPACAHCLPQRRLSLPTLRK
jgi:hypothetical protein